MSGEKVFDDLSDLCDSDEQRITEIESLCMSCGDNGMTRILLTEIPFFKQVVVMSFHCHHCHYRNNELQPAQQIAERAVRFVVTCQSPQDLSRSVVKTEWAEIQVPEIEFEVKKQSGLITTIEGILDRAVEGLKQTLQTNNDCESDTDSQSRQKICDFLLKLNELKNGNKSFTFILHDISGNSFVESLCAPEVDPNIESNHFIRTIEEDKLLGIYETENEANDDNNELRDEVLQFGTNCPNCSAPAFTNMKVQQIPHFKEVVIMATNCDSCGHKTNEVKSGAGIEDKGIKITFKVNDENDLKREVVISDTCSISIPELDIQLSSTGSGRYTTVEGIAHIVTTDLKNNPFVGGDSGKQEVKEKLNELYEKLSNLIGKTVVLDDMCGNSYISGVVDVMRYERSFQQNEDLGLNDIKTENYN